MNNLSNLLTNKKYKDTVLGQAKIKSIDRAKGRIALSMRNGLTSTGTYLYDIADLREGMNVLVGNVNGSYVILNEMQNIPRVGTSFSVRKPVVIGIRLNFEGVDGSIIFVDEATGITPSYRNNCALSSDFSFDGTTSLKLNAGIEGETDNDVELKYHDYWGMFPGEPITFPSTFKFGASVRISTTNMYGFEMWMWNGDYTSNSEIDIYTWYDEGSASFVTWIGIWDREGNTIIDEEFTDFFRVGEWDEVILTAGSNFIEVKVNNVVIISETSLISDPFSGMQDLYFWMSSYDDPVYIDKVYIRNL